MMPDNLKISPINIEKKSSKWIDNSYHIKKKKNKKLPNNHKKLNKDTCNIGNKKLVVFIFNKHKMLWKLARKNKIRKNNYKIYKNSKSNLWNKLISIIHNKLKLKSSILLH